MLCAYSFTITLKSDRRLSSAAAEPTAKIETAKYVETAFPGFEDFGWS